MTTRPVQWGQRPPLGQLTRAQQSLFAYLLRLLNAPNKDQAARQLTNISKHEFQAFKNENFNEWTSCVNLLVIETLKGNRDAASLLSRAVENQDLVEIVTLLNNETRSSKIKNLAKTNNEAPVVLCAMLGQELNSSVRAAAETKLDELLMPEGNLQGDETLRTLLTTSEPPLKKMATQLLAALATADPIGFSSKFSRPENVRLILMKSLLQGNSEAGHVLASLLAGTGLETLLTDPKSTLEAITANPRSVIDQDTARDVLWAMANYDNPQQFKAKEAYEAVFIGETLRDVSFVTDPSTGKKIFVKAGVMPTAGENAAVLRQLQDMERGFDDPAKANIVEPKGAKPGQYVVFGTSGHRGVPDPNKATFTRWHAWAIAQSVVEYRQAKGITGPLYLGFDTHYFSFACFKAVLEVLVANGIDVRIQKEAATSNPTSPFAYTATPIISKMILNHNMKPENREKQADGLVITSSHNPEDSIGVKYNPPNGGAGMPSVTDPIENRANVIFAGMLQAKAETSAVKRMRFEDALRALSPAQKQDFLQVYVDLLEDAIDMEVIRYGDVKIGVDPMSGTGLAVWIRIMEKYPELNITLLDNQIDKTFGRSPYDWDGKRRHDPSSPHAVAHLSLLEKYQLLIGHDGDADRLGILVQALKKGTFPMELMNPNHAFAALTYYLLSGARPKWKLQSGIMVGRTIATTEKIGRIAEAFGFGDYVTPVGFKFASQGLRDSWLGAFFEESAGGDILDRKGRAWVTDKDGPVMALLSAEAMAATGRSLNDIFWHILQGSSKFGSHFHTRQDTEVTPADSLVINTLKKDPQFLIREGVRIGGLEIKEVLTHTTLRRDDGKGTEQASIGGIWMRLSDGSWVLMRGSGTEPTKLKIYAESTQSEEHAVSLTKSVLSFLKEKGATGIKPIEKPAIGEAVEVKPAVIELGSPAHYTIPIPPLEDFELPPALRADAGRPKASPVNPRTEGIKFSEELAAEALAPRSMVESAPSLHDGESLAATLKTLAKIIDSKGAENEAHLAIITEPALHRVLAPVTSQAPDRKQVAKAGALFLKQLPNEGRGFILIHPAEGRAIPAGPLMLDDITSIDQARQGIILVGAENLQPRRKPGFQKLEGPFVEEIAELQRVRGMYAEKKTPIDVIIKAFMTYYAGAKSLARKQWAAARIAKYDGGFQAPASAGESLSAFVPANSPLQAIYNIMREVDNPGSFDKDNVVQADTRISAMTVKAAKVLVDHLYKTPSVKGNVENPTASASARSLASSYALTLQAHVFLPMTLEKLEWETLFNLMQNINVPGASEKTKSGIRLFRLVATMHELEGMSGKLFDNKTDWMRLWDVASEAKEAAGGITGVTLGKGAIHQPAVNLEDLQQRYLDCTVGDKETKRLARERENLPTGQERIDILRRHINSGKLTFYGDELFTELTAEQVPDSVVIGRGVTIQGQITIKQPANILLSNSTLGPKVRELVPNTLIIDSNIGELRDGQNFADQKIKEKENTRLVIGVNQPTGIITTHPGTLHTSLDLSRLPKERRAKLWQSGLKPESRPIGLFPIQATADDPTIINTAPKRRFDISSGAVISVQTNPVTQKLETQATNRDMVDLSVVYEDQYGSLQTMTGISYRDLLAAQRGNG